MIEPGEASSTRPPRSARPAPPEPYGAFAAVDGWGGVASPLLAGFAVTLIALVVQAEAQLRWPGLVLALLALAMVLFLQVVQLNARAKGYAVSPAQAREWHDDSADPQRRAVLDWELRHHLESWRSLVRRTRNRYNVGILALLAGSAAMLVPADGRALGAGRVAAIAVIASGAVVELLDLLAQRLGRHSTTGRPGRLAVRVVGALTPLYPPVPQVPFPVRGRKAPRPRAPRPPAGGAAGPSSAPGGPGGPGGPGDGQASSPS